MVRSLETHTVKHAKKRLCQNSYKQKVTLATTICGEGDFVERRVLTHPLLAYFVL